MTVSAPTCALYRSCRQTALIRTLRQ